MSYQYLNDRQHYEDRYDLQTIRECLDELQMLGKISQRMRLESKVKDYPESEHKRNMNLFAGRMNFATITLRYKNRAATIEEWYEADKAKQETQDSTLPPKVNCPDCRTTMVSDKIRTLEHWPEDKPMRVLFTLNCPKCKKRQGVYDDGEVYESKPSYCPKCDKEVETDLTFTDEITTFTTKCTSCKYKQVDVHDHAKDEAERKANEKSDAELLAKYRDEFCLSEEKGNEYVELMEAIEVGHVIHDETLAALDTPAQESLMSVKKTPITELEAMLTKALNERGFTRLSFHDPNIERYVSVPFTVQDSNSKRHERESVADLYELLKATLKDTNWRAPKDSLSYRLGFIRGTLKGYELEDDLLKLFGQERQKKPKSKLDPKLREKYEHHSYVQLAKMDAEFEVEQRIRKRRLKDEPDGFFFERSESVYSCRICYRSQFSEDIWWREDGLRCRDCWRNIQEGVIPVLDLNKKWWEADFFTKYEISIDRGVEKSAIKDLKKAGLLVGRDLKDVNGRKYETIYLSSENKEFLEEYPRKKGVT